VKGRTQGVPLDWLVRVPVEVGELAYVPRKEGSLNQTQNISLAALTYSDGLDIPKQRYPFRVCTAFGPWTSPAREIALFSLKTNCGLGPFDPCIKRCSAGCTGVELRDIAPDATLASDPNLMQMIVPTLAQQIAFFRATRKLHGANLGALCRSLLTNPAEVAEKILATNLHGPFDPCTEEIILAQARLRHSRCALV